MNKIYKYIGDQFIFEPQDILFQVDLDYEDTVVSLGPKIVPLKNCTLKWAYDKTDHKQKYSTKDYFYHPLDKFHKDFEEIKLTFDNQPMIHNNFYKYKGEHQDWYFTEDGSEPIYKIDFLKNYAYPQDKATYYSSDPNKKYPTKYSLGMYFTMTLEFKENLQEIKPVKIKKSRLSFI